MTAYDLVIVGAGLFGAVVAHEATKAGKHVLVVEKRPHVAGNCYTEDVGGIPVHRYGAHIFHTDDREVWEYVQRFAEFNRFTNSPLAKYGDELYNLPFNMNTFHQMWGVTRPEEAEAVIAEQRKEITGEPRNLEEQAIRLVGRDIYEKLVRCYTEKQWGRACTELPTFIIRRLPVRFTYDNNYFNDRWQGIPIGGYTAMAERMLDGAEVRLNTDWFDIRGQVEADRVIFTGPIDRYYDFCFGKLEYRSLKFDTVDLPVTNFQGNAVINHTDSAEAYTRVIEHKHFAYDQADVMGQPHSVVSYEYPKTWEERDEPYYPVNDERNRLLYQRYREHAEQDGGVLFAGRLGAYQYLDMDDTVRAALDLWRKLCE
ncbi:MAG: UDP-galactopyranose mutase [Clostridia bacterium]|nr:UDP-galactopyranose mutase [Clostridia bacterium]